VWRLNRRTRSSVISLAVIDSSPPQDLVLSKCSRLGSHQREVSPATGSSTGIPQDVVCGQARCSFVVVIERRESPGVSQSRTGKEHTPVTMTDNHPY
jgi:hypothetical protein